MAETKPEIKVGDTFFVFDENRRVYAKGSRGGPIYREHFDQVEITGETSRSWIISRWGMKVPKANPWSVLHTPEMVDDACWVREHRHIISDEVNRCSISQLRAIAEIIGYNPSLPSHREVR